MAVKYHVFPLFPGFAFVHLRVNDEPLPYVYTGVSVMFHGPDKPLTYSGAIHLPPYVQEATRGLFESIQGKTLAEIREIDFIIEPPVGDPDPQ